MEEPAINSQTATSALPLTLALGTLLLVLGLLAGYTLYLGRRKDPVLQSSAAEQQRGQQRQRGGGGGRQTATGRMQQRLRRRRAAAAEAATGDAGEGSGSEEEEEGEDGDTGPRNRREQRQAQRQEERERRDAAQQHRQSKQQVYDDKRRAKDAAREAEEERLQQEIERLGAERAAADAAEAAKWMGKISVEGEGTGEADEQAKEDRLAEFVDYMKHHKTVALDELAAEFGMGVQEVINRVQGLEADGRLTGVMDDRGKARFLMAQFIYISLEEMAAVASYIKERGRVAIAELAARSDTLIDLEAKADQRSEGASLDIFGDAGGAEAASPRLVDVAA